jgi:hypothetical protein
MAAVREKGALAALPQWPWVRERLELANDPAQLPLVSVLVRSMNRACLPEALASVALQTYANLELVVVNASGQAHAPLDYLPATLPWRIIESSEVSTGAVGTAAACGRARAANLALQAAHGDLALFLDDDDLLDPLHLERLVAVLGSHPQAVGAYAGVRVETHDGTYLRDYDLSWSRERLRGANFLPIHAVVFRIEIVRKRSIRFDEDLPVLEDWDFWLQLTESNDLVHCPGVSAVYRQGLGQSALGDPAHPNHWRFWHRRLLQRWVSEASSDTLAAALGWHALELDRLQLDLANQVRACQQSTMQQQAQQSELAMARGLAQQHLEARDALHQRLEAFGLETQAALVQKDAVLQVAAAESARLLADREAQAQQFAARAQRELDAAQARLHQQAAEHALQMQAKETELQRALDAKQAELQRASAESQSALQALRVSNEAAHRDLAALQQRLSHREAELRAVLASRSWRWTAPLRRGGGHALDLAP